MTDMHVPPIGVFLIWTSIFWGWLILPALSTFLLVLRLEAPETWALHGKLLDVRSRDPWKAFGVLFFVLRRRQRFTTPVRKAAYKPLAYMCMVLASVLQILLPVAASRLASLGMLDQRIADILLVIAVGGTWPASQ